MENAFPQILMRDSLVSYTITVVEALILLYNSSEIDIHIFYDNVKYKLEFLEFESGNAKNQDEKIKIDKIIFNCNRILNTNKFKKNF